MAKDLIKLTEDQKSLALNLSEAGANMADITKAVFIDESLDGRSIEGKSIKAFLINHGKEVKTTKYEKTGNFELNEEQKDIVKQNVDSVSSATEMTRLVFRIPDDEKIEPLSKEFKAVFAYIKSISKNTSSNEEPVDDVIYKPPLAIQHVIGKVNTYVRTGNGKKAYDWNNLTKDDRKNLETLVSYMNVQRFVYQASQYERKVDRDLYESSFIRYTHDKPDLTEEEVDQYMALCEEVVLAISASRRKIKLENEVDRVLDSDERRFVSQPMVEAIKDLKNEIEKSKARQEKLVNTLSGTRRDRIKGKTDRNSSVLNLLEAWQKEEKRNDIINLGIAEHEKDEKEFDRLSNMDAVQALIAGMSKDEAIH